MASSNIDRRKFLRGAAGAGASLSLLPLSLQQAMAQPVTPGSLADVDHVVILVQENRSFDHYFGTYPGVRGFDDPNPQRFQNGKTVFSQPTGSNVVLPYRAKVGGVVKECIADPAHDWGTGHQAWNNGKYDQWIAAKTSLAMSHYTRPDIPFHFALADSFTLCDNYYCSLMSSTAPNRLYVWTGTSSTVTGGGDAPGNHWTWTTYAELMENNSISWQTYQETDNYGDNALDGFDLFTTAPTSSNLYKRGIKRSATGMSIVDFKTAITNDALPAVSYIVGPRETTEHPSWSPAAGAHYIHSILDALASKPEVWQRTVFIITYDENGGFWDHVVPPMPPTESFQSSYRTDEVNNSYGTPFGLGARVPTFVISPWSRGGRTCSETFDHTSINRFLEKWIKARFNKTVAAPNISPWRKAICGDLTSTLSFGADYTVDTTVPAWPATAVPASCSTASLTAPTGTNQVLLSQESGQRVLQPLPYQMGASLRPDTANNRTWLDFTNTGSAGASVSVVYNEFRTYSAFAYVVPTGTTSAAPVSDYFGAGTGGYFDNTAYGPNGFTRRYRGKLANYSVEITASYDTANNRVVLSMKNTKTTGGTIQVKVSSCGYRTDGPWVYDVGPGLTVTDDWYTKDGWYDLVAYIPSDPTFLRTFTGHIEGKVSKTYAPGIISRTVASVIGFDSQGTTDKAAHVLNGNPMLGWQSADAAGTHYLTVDLGGTRSLKGITYLPRQDDRTDPYKGMIAGYKVYTSADNSTWTQRATGTWSKDFKLKSATFTAVSARYVKLEATSEVNGGTSASAAEINFIVA